MPPAMAASADRHAKKGRRRVVNTRSTPSWDLSTPTSLRRNAGCQPKLNVAGVWTLTGLLTKGLRNTAMASSDRTGLFVVSPIAYRRTKKQAEQVNGTGGSSDRRSSECPVISQNAQTLVLYLLLLDFSSSSRFGSSSSSKI